MVPQCSLPLNKAISPLHAHTRQLLHTTQDHTCVTSPVNAEHEGCFVASIIILGVCCRPGLHILAVLHILAGLHCDKLVYRRDDGFGGEGVGESGLMRQYTLPVLLAWVDQQCAVTCSITPIRMRKKTDMRVVTNDTSS
ncbi:hypothetical protein Pmani_036820 [Petrolisthes manimaculis]|uniref:Uncharacterized protein n=1 Tax=Petrolisthes manimaculis TaxID=1843537 RepID=A0AAE1NI18_9EUCA|nr:hypothetical protein Pmani_036820 [Petrolisthes manimaculis]